MGPGTNIISAGLLKSQIVISSLQTIRAKQLLPDE
jgi:hypothetical protein